MEIGDKKILNIKYHFFNESDDYTNIEKEKWLFGQFCFQIGSEIIGNYKEWTSFIVIRNYISVFLENYKNRFVPFSVYNLQKEDIFNIYYERFYSNDVNTEYKNFVLPIDEYSIIRNTFHMDDIGESSFRDKFGIIIINYDKYQKIIWKDFKTKKVYEKIIPENYIENLIEVLFLNINNEISKTMLSPIFKQNIQLN